MDSWQYWLYKDGGYPHPTGFIADWNTPRAFSSFSICKSKGGIWLLDCSREVGSLNYLEGLRVCVIWLFPHYGSGLLFFSKTYGSLSIREKLGIQFWQEPTRWKKLQSWCLVCGLKKLRTLWSLYKSRSNSCPDTDNLIIKPEFGQTENFLWWS